MKNLFFVFLCLSLCSCQLQEDDSPTLNSQNCSVEKELSFTTVALDTYSGPNEKNYNYHDLFLTPVLFQGKWSGSRYLGKENTGFDTRGDSNYLEECDFSSYNMILFTCYHLDCYYDYSILSLSLYGTTLVAKSSMEKSENYVSTGNECFSNVAITIPKILNPVEDFVVCDVEGNSFTDIKHSTKLTIVETAEDDFVVDE